MEVVTGVYKVLEVDLNSGESRVFEVSDNDLKLFLGGKGLAYKLLYERVKVGIEPLSEENIIIFMTGPVTATGAPLSGRFSAVSKSPLTGLFGSSNCGGPFGVSLKTAGYLGLILRGKAKEPVILEISHDIVNIIPAGELWGKTTGDTQNALNLGRHDGALVIGPAGENLVKFACIRSGDRFLGRLGFGAVLGSKNVKAIVARGGYYKIVPVDRRKFDKVKKKALSKIKINELSQLYHRYGTNTNILYSAKTGLLPVKNFQTFDAPKEIERISGPYIEENFDLSPHPCAMCSLVCGHKMRRDGKVVNVPEYETNALFGSSCALYDFEEVSEINDMCNELGLDTISTSGTISYIMEACERGVLDLGLKFGDAKRVKDLIKDIAYRKGFGDEAANGSRYLAEKYGGIEFAMQVKGLELAAYDPRNSVGHGLSYAVANRGGCHLSSPQFVMEAYLGLLDPVSPLSKAHYVVFLENVFNIINSIVTCVFTTFAYVLEDPVIKLSPKPVLRFLMSNFPNIVKNFINIGLYRELFEATSGIRISKRELLESGERIHLLERYLNVREGVRKEHDTLPLRLLGELKPVPLEKMLEDYYRLRHYDGDGRPDLDYMRRLGLEVD
ncbi:MAG: aldehyde ferredoxin oxidoreductase family protein [candidate division WOR-3 bacterium]